MKKTVLGLSHFAPIDQVVAFLQAEEILWENEDNYQKQTYRNRQYIYGANGKLLLNIPITHTHSKDGRQKYKDVKIENQFHWQKIHWKSLESAYRTSPFFEFYEDELAPLYEKSFRYLMDYNYHCWEALLSCLQLEKTTQKTTEYLKSYREKEEFTDCRLLNTAKRKAQGHFTPYTQVFQEKYGFIPNLSILDLLFNKGPQTKAYLEAHDLGNMS